MLKLSMVILVDFVFVLNSILLGTGLAMDAFSVSLANGLNEPRMNKRRMCLIAGIFSLFQFLMPMLGWICVHTIMQYFTEFEKFIPWIALVLLLYIGGKMLVDGFKNEEEEVKNKLWFSTLLIQGVATSIDALSVGFTNAAYSFGMSLVCCIIIAFVTFIICMSGVYIGKKFGTKFAGKATMLGGVILIAIGIEILITGLM